MSGRALSERELSVARMVAEGKTNAQIAETLGCSVGNAANMVVDIYNKTGCENRALLTRWYIEQTAGAA